MNIYLLQGVYTPDHEVRKSEIELCLQKNSENPLIHKFLHLQGRPTYNDCFRIMRERAASTQQKNIYVLANSDIYFDETLALVQSYAANNPEYATDKTCFALSKWDVRPTGELVHWSYPDSQDAWIFFDAVPYIQGADFYVGGQAGCDNKIAYLLEQSGYTLLNPSLSVKAIHVHNSDVRTNPNIYFDRLQPPFKLIPASSL